MQLIATHLGLCLAERREQVCRLLPLFKVQDRDMVVLAGDLNEWFLWSHALRMLKKLFPETPHRRSWPARVPLFSLGGVFSPDGDVRNGNRSRPSWFPYQPATAA
jgi:endonuclease/exonuclease/phosphatase family metal-dependent hydrolase